jgi:hypothetical protein
MENRAETVKKRFQSTERNAAIDAIRSGFLENSDAIDGAAG